MPSCLPLSVRAWIDSVITALSAAVGLPREHWPRNLTLALGTADLSPVQMAQAYAAFANGRPAAVNVGVRPTFESGRGVLIETHIIDHDEDLYGRPLRVAFVKRLRGEKRFDGVDDLVEPRRVGAPPRDGRGQLVGSLPLHPDRRSTP